MQSRTSGAVRHGLQIRAIGTRIANPRHRVLGLKDDFRKPYII